jgi:hypothetical protein
MTGEEVCRVCPSDAEGKCAQRRGREAKGSVRGPRSHTCFRVTFLAHNPLDYPNVYRVNEGQITLASSPVSI